MKSNNVMLTIRGFVSEAKTKASGNSPSTQDVDYTDNKFIAIMNKYWKSKNLDEHTWGEDMILAAFEGTKVGSNTHLDFSTVGRDFRKEARARAGKRVHKYLPIFHLGDAGRGERLQC